MFRPWQALDGTGNLCTRGSLQLVAAAIVQIALDPRVRSELDVCTGHPHVAVDGTVEVDLSATSHEIAGHCACHVQFAAGKGGVTVDARAALQRDVAACHARVTVDGAGERYPPTRDYCILLHWTGDLDLVARDDQVARNVGAHDDVRSRSEGIAQQDDRNTHMPSRGRVENRR